MYDPHSDPHNMSDPTTWLPWKPVVQGPTNTQAPPSAAQPVSAPPIQTPATSAPSQTQSVADSATQTQQVAPPTQTQPIINPPTQTQPVVNPITQTQPVVNPITQTQPVAPPTQVQPVINPPTQNQPVISPITQAQPVGNATMQVQPAAPPTQTSQPVVQTPPVVQVPTVPTPPTAPELQPVAPAPVAAPPTQTQPTGTPAQPIDDADAAWHREACVEAIVDTNAALLTKTAAENPGSRAMRAVVVRSDRLWTNGTVLNCAFMDKGPLTTFKANQQAKVKKSVLEWQKYANVTFNFIDDVTSATVRITFNARDGSWSFVGKEVSSIPPNQATMNLGWIDGSNEKVSPTENGVILHEFGHTLGLMHEHQSPVRGNKLTLKEDAVIKFYTSTQGWTVDEVRSQIIDVYNKQDISNYSDVDLTSIMQYFMPPALNVEGIRVNPNDKLSEIDKAFMIINYPPVSNAPPGQSSPQRDQFIEALDAVGVVGDGKETILMLYDQQNWPEVRYEFTRFCTDMRVARKAAKEQPTIPDRAATPPEVIPDGCLTGNKPSSAAKKGAAKAVASIEADLWLPGDTITYSYVQGSLHVTEYRRKRIKETFDYYSSRTNIKFEEIPFEPKSLLAKVHIYFGDIPTPGITAWCEIGKEAIGYRQTEGMIKVQGGSPESSFVISDDAVPKVAPTQKALIRQDMRTLFHEVGHMLGLKHEHASPNTMTNDKPDPRVSAVTIFDEKSIMLYAGRELRASSMWQRLKNYFDSNLTEYNHTPSKIDIAFLGAIYPRPKYHVDDRLEQHLKDLGLKSDVKTLTGLRDAAFAIEGHAGFGDAIKAYRRALKEKLAALVPSRTLAPTGPSRTVQIPPSNFKAARDANATPPSEATTGSFSDELVKILQSMFRPSSGQLFALQFPGRFLQQDLYAWDTNTAGIYGQFVKPTVVNESEFRLVDQLYNVGTVIGAPNGINLSIVYEQCLNNLVPGIQQSAINLSKQQGEIRQWLLKEVPTSGWVKDLIGAQNTQANSGPTSSSGPANAARAINASSAISNTAKPQFAVANRLSDDNSVNRMELADALMQEYLSAKQAWELERDEMIKNTDGKNMNDLTRKLAHITAIREAQLASKHADAVVRGYSHAIRQYLGFLDIKSPAEMLQEAKDAFRESAASSLDGSMKIFPVQMSPIDWFQSLSTSFTMEDLTVNADVIAQQIDIKSKQLDVLNTRLAIIQSKPKTDLTALQDKLDAAQTAYDNAQAELSTTYTSNVISLAKTFIDSTGKFQLEDFKASAKVAKIADAAFDNIQAGMDKLTAAQLSVTQTSRALTLLMSQKSLAEASDTTQEIIETNVQITALTKEIQELTTRLQSLRYSPSAAPPSAASPDDPEKPPSVNDVDLYPPNTTSGGSRWQEIYMKHVIDNKYTSSSETSQATTSKTDVSLFFGSYHSEQGQSSGQSESQTASQSLTVEVGFRATMVTVDRGGWFQPQFFKQSAGFHSIDPRITWSKWPAGVETLRDLTKDDGKMFTELNKHLLPAYPVGFVVCKDITIRIHMSKTDIATSGAEMEKYAASSAGVLCWSTSSSDRNKTSDKSYSFAQKSDGCIIRIPGPQILGYMLQFTDNDESTPLPDKLPDGFLLSDADYDSSFNSQPAPSSSVNPNTVTPQPTK